MKRALAVAVIVAGLLILIPVLASTLAAASDHFQRDEASASFVSSAGCVRTQVDVTALSGNARHGGNQVQTLSEAHVALTQFNTCTNATVLEAEGRAPLSGNDLTVTANLGTAALDVAVPVTDEDSGATFTLQVQVTWSNPRGVSHGSGHVRVPGGSADIATNIDGQDFSATATISRAGINLSPEPATYARVSRVRDTGA